MLVIEVPPVEYKLLHDELSYLIETSHLIMVYTYLYPHEMYWENVYSWESYQENTKEDFLHTP